MKEEPKYYSYMIIFRGETEDVQPIIGVCDLEKLRLENQGRMHLFDDLLIPILPAVEYCLHMPRLHKESAFLVPISAFIAANRGIWNILDY